MTDDDRYHEYRTDASRMDDARLAKHISERKARRTRAMKRGYPQWHYLDIQIRACEDERAYRREPREAITPGEEW